MKFGWKTRIGLVLSTVWLILAILIADDDHRVGQVLGFGLLPLVILWGIIWAVAGWRAQRPAKPEMPEAKVLETKRNRSHRIRPVIAVVAVLVIGLFAATWQFHAADTEAGGDVIAYWTGEWLVYGLLAYVVFRYIPQMPPGFPAVLAAIVVVSAVNYKAYSTISDERQARFSLAKATPLINKIQSGTPVSDQEIKDAHVGVMQPLLLAQAAYSRDVIAINTAYTKSVSEVQPDRMLTPASLASPNIRAQSRARLRVWEQATANYKSQFDAALARGKLGVQAAQFQMPASLAGGASKGFDESSFQLGVYVDSLVSSEREASDTITAILDLMDANPGGYAVDKGPPANLLFYDEATLARYRQLTATIMAVGQRETEAQTSLSKAQSARTDKLADLLKR